MPRNNADFTARLDKRSKSGANETTTFHHPQAPPRSFRHRLISKSDRIRRFAFAGKSLSTAVKAGRASIAYRISGIPPRPTGAGIVDGNHRENVMRIARHWLPWRHAAIQQQVRPSIPPEQVQAVKDGAPPREQVADKVRGQTPVK
jgi:hypothetical protein